MGRTAGQYCGREATYSLQANPVPPEPVQPAETPKLSMSDELTWQQQQQQQQQQEFGTTVLKNKGKAVQWKRPDISAVDDAPITSAIGNSSVASFAQPAEFYIVNPHRQPRGKAAVTPSQSACEPPSIEQSSEETATKNEATEQTDKQSGYRRKHKPMANPAKEQSSVLTAMIPPHLRKRIAATVPPHLRKKAAAAPVAGAQQVNSSATNKSSCTSEKSKPGQLAKPVLAPHVPSQPLTPPSSLPATPKELQFNDVAVQNAPEVKTPSEQISPEDKGAEGQVLGGWDDPVPNPPPVAPRAYNNPRWPRPERAPKRHVWPKQSEMRAPSRSSSDGGVTFKSTSDNDPDYDIKKLMDWHGDWLPPPEDWTARKGHTNRHFGSGIEKWIEEHPIECTEILKYDPVTFLEDGSCKELVPRYWLISSIESQPATDFWRDMPIRTPAALTDCDPFADPPFWDRFEGATHLGEPSCFIDGLVVPDAQVNPEDLDNHDPRGDILASADHRMKLIHQRKARNQRRTVQKQTRPFKESKPAGPPVEDRRIRPKSNVYFRPVQPTDVEGIAAIYNHYVEETIFANEFDCRTPAQIGARIDEVIENGLPYLVAVARGNQPRGPQGYISEKIVGFISLADLCDRSSMFRFTFELELYVHPGYLSQNIASCLLDRLLEFANTGYRACGGYEYRNDSDYLKIGPGRVIKTIMLSVNKEPREDVEKTNTFLKKFKFKYVGHKKEMGHKYGKVVDIHEYQHLTSEVIDATSKPSVPLERARG